MLEAEDTEIDMSIPSTITISANPEKRKSELARLRRMVMSGQFQARLTAVKSLGHDRDLDNVPVLIYALSDPDFRVVRAADEGLRFISRKLDGIGLRVEDKPPTRQQWMAAQASWQAWYRSIRPDGALIE